MAPSTRRLGLALSLLLALAPSVTLGFSLTTSSGRRVGVGGSAVHPRRRRQSAVLSMRLMPASFEGSDFTITEYPRPGEYALTIHAAPARPVATQRTTRHHGPGLGSPP